MENLFQHLMKHLSGLRVIKAFNIETLLKGIVSLLSMTELLNAKNHIGYRRDLASPLSEFMGCDLLRQFMVMEDSLY